MGVVQSTDSTLRIDQWLTIGLLMVVFALEGAYEPVPKDFLRPIVVPQIAMAMVPVQTKLPILLPATDITAKSYIVVDLDSAAVLASREPDAAMYPASTTKMVTALIAASTFSPTEVWELTADDLKEKSAAGFQVGDKVRVGDILAALLIQSDNAAAELLANRFPGGKLGMLTAMSRWASYHGMTHQIFIDPAGFDADSQLVSARDLSIVAKELLQQPLLADLVSQTDFTLTIQRQTRTILLPLKNTNHLLGQIPGKDGIRIYGIKTGTTVAAGEVLVTAAESRGHTLIVVLMGSEDRFAETAYLLNSTYQNYSWHSAE